MNQFLSNFGVVRKQWHINNNIYYIPKCYVCEINDARWWGKRKGGKYVTCSESCRRKAIQMTFNKKYGGNPMSNSSVRKKKAKTEERKYSGMNMASLAQKARNPEYILALKTLIGNDYELMFYDKTTTPRYSKVHEIKHIGCGNTFKIKAANIRLRLKRGHELCLVCGIHAGFSLAEKDMVLHIREISKLEVVENFRIGRHYTVDAYLPDLHLGFCFDGDYYHAHPALFDADDVVSKTHKSAKEIWDKDKRMNKVAEEEKILLVRIWERNWLDGSGKTMINRILLNISHRVQV